MIVFWLTILGFVVLSTALSLQLTLAIIGTALMSLGSLGVYRMPDVYCRMHALSKATTLGVSGVLAALAFELGDVAGLTKLILAIFFFLLTVPVSTHAIGRAAYLAGLGLGSNEFVVDQWNRFGRSPTSVLFRSRHSQALKAVRLPEDEEDAKAEKAPDNN